MSDCYKDYEELSSCEQEGTDYEIITVTEGRDPSCVVMAPHGGQIEPCTFEIAERIAANSFALYGFKGKKKRDNRKLHLTSHRFDEPRAVELAQRAQVVLAVHGQASNKCEFVMVGGLHQDLASVVRSSLKRIGIYVPDPPPGLDAKHSMNICNRAQRGGVQLEISRRLRNALAGDKKRFKQFTDIVHDLLHRETQDA